MPLDLDLGIITSSLSPAGGGLFESVRLPANKLAQQGARVTVYGIWEDQLEAVRSAWQGPRLETFQISAPKRLFSTPEMLPKVVAADHQLLHLHGIWLYQSHVIDKWRRRTRRPTIISPRGMLDPWAMKISALKKRALRMLFEDRNLKGATAIHALNESEVRAIRAFGLTNPVAVIPNGVVLPDSGHALPRPSWMEGDDRKVLLFLGRLHPKKGLSELIAAWARVRTMNPTAGAGWRVVVAGWDDGGHQGALETEVLKAALGAHVTFVGPIQGDDKAKALRHASAFILPSHSEGMPMAVLEAWAFGLPVFMTQACNLPQSFACGAAIEIATAPEAMAATLAASLDYTERLISVGQAGYTLVERYYTWDRIVGDMRHLYAWVLGKAEQPEFVV
jgi:glycosyltransferase involved in cell wall biosynthesis